MERERGRRGRRSLESAESEIKDARVDVVLQRIEELIGNEVDVIPKKVRRYGVNNIFQRVFAYLIAKKSDGKYIQLQSTIAGALKIASVGAGLERSEIKTGTATEELSAKIEFSQVVSRVHVGCTTYELSVYHSPDGITFYGPLHCYDYYPNIFDISCKAIKVIRAEDNDVDYDIAGLW